MSFFLKNSIIKHRTRMYLYLSKLVSQKLYWNIVGIISPLDSILNNCFNLEVFFKTGKEFVIFCKKNGLIHKNSRTLHIGCGIGRIEKHIALAVGKSYGVDISDSMINSARKYVNPKNVCFITTDGQHLPFEDNYFDFVYSLLVFQHMPRQMFRHNLDEIKRILRSKGKLFFQIPIDENGQKEDPPENNPWLMRYYKRKQINHLLNERGLKVLATFDGLSKDRNQSLQPNFSVLAFKS